MMVFIRSICF